MNDSHLPAPLIEPIAVADLLYGESYDTWLCKSCRNVIALAPREPWSDPFDMPPGIVTIPCPHCHARNTYEMQERAVRRYPWRDPAPAE